MRLMLLWGVFLCLVLPGVAASAQLDLYDNGPVNGSTDAWEFDSGFVVSNAFSLNVCTTWWGPQGCNIDAFAFATWTFQGDVLQSAELSITSSEFGGTTYFDQVLSFQQSDCSSNQYGFNVCLESASFNGPTLNDGTYWINLQNAVVNDGDSIYWDENSGPSSASQNVVGTIASEAFTIYGTQPFCWWCATSPEPNSAWLFGSAILGVLPLLRRRMH